MFNSIKSAISRSDQHHKDKSDLEREAKQFKLPGEGLPQGIKYAFFIGLAFLNYRLFSHTIPGVWEQATGVAAVMVEGLALYCAHNFSRSAELFRWALGICGAFLALFSIGHGIASIFALIGVPEVIAAVAWYSHMIAFPLLAVLLGASAVALCMTHPKNIIRLRQALAHTEIATGKAEAASQLELMRAQSVLEQAKLENARERSRREAEYLAELEKWIELETKKRALVHNLSDADLREAIARELDMRVKPAALPDREASTDSSFYVNGAVPKEQRH